VVAGALEEGSEEGEDADSASDAADSAADACGNGITLAVPSGNAGAWFKVDLMLEEVGTEPASPDLDV
jgi:hypothetical protein